MMSSETGLGLGPNLGKGGVVPEQLLDISVATDGDGGILVGQVNFCPRETDGVDQLNFETLLLAAQGCRVKAGDPPLVSE